MTRDTAYVVVVMRFYPRFVRKEKVDEYARVLAPEAGLFAEFKAKDRELKNHNSAFYLVNYEARFDLAPEGRAKLAEVAALSRERDVVLVCQCRDYDRCHCDLLLLWAERHFGAEIRGLAFDYPVFKSRLDSLA